MNNAQMIAALAALPDPDLLAAAPIDAPLGSRTYYQADTVVRLLAAQQRPNATAGPSGGWPRFTRAKSARTMCRLFRFEESTMTNTTTQDNHYASAQETASVIRPATADEAWLHAQLDRLDPHRLEAGGAGDTPALIKLVFDLKGQAERHLSQALLDVAAERQRQDAKWGGPEHDDGHHAGDWHRFVSLRLARVPVLASNGNAAEVRRMWVQIAALAVAAAESIDRTGTP